MQNLIGNALKYRSKEPPRVYVSAERRGTEWNLAVCDNGIGISPKYHQKIFEISVMPCVTISTESRLPSGAGPDTPLRFEWSESSMSFSQAKKLPRTDDAQFHEKCIAIRGGAVGNRAPDLSGQIRGRFKHISGGICWPR